MSGSKPTYPVNVKIPQLYVEIVDENLKEGKNLQKLGFKGRAHFVRESVKEKLMELGLLSEEDQEKLEKRKRKR
jgi:Arc/MetJ-type ribon-helix-helix transcriptional regulator